MFLEGKRHDLMKSLDERMAAAAEQELFEQAAAYRDLLRTLEDIEERQRIAAAQAMIPTCLRITQSRHSSPRTCFTCVAAASWTAANFTGKTSQNLIRTNLCPRC